MGLQVEGRGIVAWNENEGWSSGQQLDYIDMLRQNYVQMGVRFLAWFLFSVSLGVVLSARVYSLLTLD